MRLAAVELRHVELPLRRPFRTAAGSTTKRRLLLVRLLVEGGAEGWGECAALDAPTYTAEDVDTATDVLRRHLVPRLLSGAGRAGDGGLDATIGGRVEAGVVGHPMAKAALEAALLDVQLRQARRSLADHLGATRGAIPAGVAIGMHDTTDSLLDEVGAVVRAGYRRVKLKIAPGRDRAPVTAVRAAFPTLALAVDANGSYAALGHSAATAALAALDDLGLVFLEQPLATDDLLGHAALGRRLQTPICLDESITSLDSLATALAVGACTVVNVKAGRVGGLGRGVAILEACDAAGINAWVGGMLESGVGRAAALALAAHPACTLPGDLAASDRYFAPDLAGPHVLDPTTGEIAVPNTVGLGAMPDPDVLSATTTWSELLRRS